MGIFAPYDIIVDGTDNFADRATWSTTPACSWASPYVYGSIFRFDGQAIVFCPPTGPATAASTPSRRRPGMVPSCAEGGVLGVLSGSIGSIQATEALKLSWASASP